MVLADRLAACSAAFDQSWTVKVLSIEAKSQKQNHSGSKETIDTRMRIL